jgi:hypothetical protein
VVRRVDWQYLLEQNVDESLQSHVDRVGQSEGGRLVHDWLQETFEGELDLMWENYCENGKYDAYDGDNLVYEFKTKHPNVFDDRPPYSRDRRQLEGYLEADDLDADYGVLVYINRGDLTEVDEYFYDGNSLIDL